MLENTIILSKKSGNRYILLKEIPDEDFYNIYFMVGLDNAKFIHISHEQLAEHFICLKLNIFGRYKKKRQNNRSKTSTKESTGDSPVDPNTLIMKIRGRE